jgi:hypothetical protein
MGFYTRDGLVHALSKYGVWGSLIDRGFAPRLEFGHLDRRRERLQVWDDERGDLLVELVCQFADLKPRAGAAVASDGSVWRMLAVEWLLMQNPRRPFVDPAARLPGQRHPGLGLGRSVMALLEVMAGRLDRDGLLAFPEHYHNGFFYDRRFAFVDPQRQGELKALERDLGGLTLAEASWAVDAGLVTDQETGAPYVWRGEEMVRAMRGVAESYFAASSYRQIVATVAAKRHYAVRRDALAVVMQKVAMETLQRE